MPRPREWYYPKPHKLGREIRWNLGPWEVQDDRGVPLRQVPGKEAKVHPSPRTRLCEGHVQPREATGEGAQAMDFESYGAFFDLSPEGQAEGARRVRQDEERNVAKQAEAETMRVADELEREEKEKIEKE